MNIWQKSPIELKYFFIEFATMHSGIDLSKKDMKCLKFWPTHGIGILEH